MADAIRSLTLSHVVLPLENPVSDAKVLTGRQKPLTETDRKSTRLNSSPGVQSRMPSSA